jgi:hypothetical protein
VKRVAHTLDDFALESHGQHTELLLQIADTVSVPHMDGFRRRQLFQAIHESDEYVSPSART